MEAAEKPRELAPSLTELRDRFVAAQLAGDRREALRLVLEDGLGAGTSVADLQLAVIQEAQREIGRLWQENRISIAQEHMATAISQVVLAHLYDRARRASSNGKRVIVACVEGELHDLPARLAADALDLAGFEVRYLGASVPIEGLLAMIDEVRPDLLALSVTMAFNAPALREAVKRVRAHTGGRLPMVVGGSASRGLVSEPGLAVSTGDARAFVEVAAELLHGAAA